MAKFWYLATPYSKYKAGHDGAADAAVEQAALFAQAGITVFSPIAYTHQIAVAGKLPPGADYWLAYDLAFMEASCGLIICKLDGWEFSEGIEREFEWYTQQGYTLQDKPIIYMEPGIIPPQLLK